jgi:hypothetical protein
MIDRIQNIEPLELEAIKTYAENQPDNLFICWGSPEERCKGAALKLHLNYKAEHVLILKYSNHGSKKREDNINEMKKRLKNVGKIEEILIDENKPLPMLRKICEKIEGLLSRSHIQSCITIDISTPIKWHLLILLKFLDLRNLLGCARFLYTEPEDYITDLFQSLSFGIKEIFPIPTYYGNYDFSKRNLLVLMLGYEGSRAMAIYEDIDPAECLLLVADPPYRKEWKGRTEDMNKEIIGVVGASKIRYVHSRNPLEVGFQLQKILSENEYADYNHIISPLGTKPQTLGLYSYLSTNPLNTMVMYGAPLRHNELFYSSGIGKTWELPFVKLKAC